MAPPVFVAVLVERNGPRVARWDVSKKGVTLLQVVTRKAAGEVRVTIAPLPRTWRPPVSETGPDGHAAFNATCDWYDWRSLRDPVNFPPIDLEDWREIEDALDAVRALDVD